ncbi:hypothetical protein MRX96_047579 [Rhipicephalus microplus]
MEKLPLSSSGIQSTSSEALQAGLSEPVQCSAGVKAKLFRKEFSDRNMDGFLGKCLLMVYATAVVTLTIAPNVAEAFPSFILDAILKAGRTEEMEE